MNDIAAQRKEQLVIMKINKLKREKEELENDLKLYRSDFAILTNAEEVLAQLVAILSDNHHIIKALNNSLDDIYSIGTKNKKITGVNKMFKNFRDAMENSNITKISEGSDNCSEYISDKGSDIDEAQDRVASKIEGLKEQIENKEAEIQQLWNSL